MRGYFCDGCGKYINGKPNRITADEWNIDACIRSYERLYDTCNRMDCKYNIEGEVCVDFNFCNKCSKNKSILNRRFESFKR